MVNVCVNLGCGDVSMPQKFLYDSQVGSATQQMRAKTMADCVWAESVAKTKQGIVGIKVSVLAPDKKVHDQVEVNEDLINAVKKNVAFVEEEIEVKPTKKTKKKGAVKKKGEKEIKENVE